MKTSIRCHAMTGHVGAVVEGVDLKELTKERAAELRSAWLEHKVLFFRAQHLSADELVCAASFFGEVEPLHQGLNRLPENERVLLVETKDGMGDGPDGSFWHSDVTFDSHPPMASLMYCVKMPEVGGDTLFASMTAAWKALAPPLQELVAPLQAFHDGIPYFARYLMQPAQHDGLKRLAQLKVDQPGAIHPVVRRHEETGALALFVNRPFTQHIVGLSEIESRHLLNLLIEHVEQISFQVRWRWSEGDVALWDNRQAMHNPAYDYGLAHRIMYRVTLRGSEPQGTEVS